MKHVVNEILGKVTILWDHDDMIFTNAHVITGTNLVKIYVHDGPKSEIIKQIYVWPLSSIKYLKFEENK